MLEAQRQRDHARQAEQEDTAKLAADFWIKADEATSHQYLAMKGIRPNGLRQSGNILFVPLIDIHGKLWNLQRIYPDGSKRLLKGGRIKGCFALIGQLDAGRVYVCEGFATGATIHQETGAPVVCAMNAGNLKAVCQALADPSLDIVVAADNDHRTEVNPGLIKAREAAAAIGATLTWPVECGDGCTCTDYNDRAMCPRQQGVA